MSTTEAERVRERMPAIIAAEVDAINRTFAGTRPGRPSPAGTKPAWVTVAGRSYIAYGLGLDPTVRPEDIGRLTKKIQEALSALRGRPTPVRLRYMPLALEVEHPFPAPLDWRKANVLGKHDTMLVGRNYGDGEPHDEVLSFEQQPHALIAGTTGSGKSTLMRMALCSLAMRTDPDALRLILVDMKNKDLLPFRALPHADGFAGEEREAHQTIRTVHRELQRRRAAADNSRDPRIVLAIDELADVGDRETLDLLSSILRRGRAYRINVIAATQLPTKATCGEKNNYTVRLVGAITDAQTAVTASGRGDTGAHLLPGAGAFVRVEGNRLGRIQAYWLDDAGTETLVANARERWPGRDGRVEHRQYTELVYRHTAPILAENWPVQQRDISASTSGTGVVQPVRAVQTVPVAQPVHWPIPDRPLTATEAAAARRMYGGGLPRGRSKNSVIAEVWGDLTNKPKRLDWLNQAIEGGAA